MAPAEPEYDTVFPPAIFQEAVTVPSELACIEDAGTVEPLTSTSVVVAAVVDVLVGEDEADAVAMPTQPIAVLTVSASNGILDLVLTDPPPKWWTWGFRRPGVLPPGRLPPARDRMISPS